MPHVADIKFSITVHLSLFCVQLNMGGDELICKSLLSVCVFVLHNFLGIGVVENSCVLIVATAAK